MVKIDLYTQHKSDYVAPSTPAIVTITPAKYLAVSGAGAPKGKSFQAAFGALYTVAFTIKMASKFRGRDYRVMMPEGLWWGPTGREHDFAKVPASKWRWQLIMRTPPFITAADLTRAQKELIAKGKPATVRDVKLITLKEGRSVQMLHVGPYSAEKRTVDAMRVHAEAQGFRLTGKHHEIYLSDPRRVPAARLKTILRHPVR